MNRRDFCKFLSIIPVVGISSQTQKVDFESNELEIITIVADTKVKSYSYFYDDRIDDDRHLIAIPRYENTKYATGLDDFVSYLKDFPQQKYVYNIIFSDGYRSIVSAETPLKLIPIT